MGPAVDNLVTLLNDGGVLALLVLAVVGFARGWFVSRREYDELEKDRNWWRDVAMTSVRLGEAAVTTTLPTEATDLESRVGALEARNRRGSDR